MMVTGNDSVGVGKKLLKTELHFFSLEKHLMCNAFAIKSEKSSVFKLLF